MQRRPINVRVTSTADVTDIIAELVKHGIAYDDRTRVSNTPGIRETAQVALFGENTTMNDKPVPADLIVTQTPTGKDEITPDKLVDALKEKKVIADKGDAAKVDDDDAKQASVVSVKDGGVIEQKRAELPFAPKEQEAAQRMVKAAVGAEGHESPTEIAHAMKARHKSLLGLG